MTTTPSDDSQSPAERLYHDFAAKRERGEVGPSDFDALCAANPALSNELRALAQRDAAGKELLGRGELAGNSPAHVAGASPNFFHRNRTKSDPSASGFARSFKPGETIGDFKLVRYIGHGGMGQVWEATQLSMRRSVALKFILPGRADAHTLSLFEREARAGGKTSHPGLVRTLARGQAEGIEWIAQELVAGSYSLRDAIEDFRREPVLPKEYYSSVARLVRGIALGMQAAHDAGVIHRDLKPQNILIDQHDQPKVADFGLARVAGDSVLSNTGDFAGTYQYMSPEQVTAKRMGLDHRTDIFSLGVVMYELLTLSRPFDGDTTQKIAEAIVTLDPPDPSKLRAQCPRDLGVICAKAMQKRPGARYGSMREFAEDLERHLKNEEILAKPATRVEKVRKWVLRHSAQAVGIGVGSTALVVISALALFAQGQADEARRNAETAARNAEKERIAREEATQKANDVLSLSAQKDYEDLVASAEQLWPAESTMIPRYEAWMRQARQLLEGQPGDESKGLKKRPSLAEHQAKLRELRSDALPLSDEQIRTDRESHPKYGEWKSKSADLLWCSRMLAIEAWPDRAAVEAELAAESAAKQLPSDADGLNALSWKLVDPKQPVLGEEVRALLLAKRALDMAAADKRAGIRDTYAWALYRTGKLDEALDEMKTAVSEPGGDELKASQKELEKAVQQWQGDEVAKRRERRESLSKEVDALAAAVSERRTFEYADAEKSWWDRQLRVLVANLEPLQDEKTGLAGVGITSEQGWGVGRRYELAKSLRERTIDGPEAKRRWEEAILAIAKSEKYRDTVFPGGGLLTPQEGLLPLGADPQSGLWEFWHVQSGDEPERDKEGKFVRQKSGAHKLVERSDRGTGTANQGTGTADQGTGIADQGTGVFGSGTGIVLVLIPGGTFWMGAQKTDPNGQNFDPEARSDESVYRVTLSPYFLSKYELTQGQWQRFTGSNPSSYKSGDTTIGPTNPVEQVSWLDCERVLRRLGLQLPSEAQWEFGARGGTSSVWWTGSEKESLADKVNLADKSFVAVGGPVGVAAWWPEFNDGFPVHAPVGRLGANDFGLHEVCGNVWEWCFDTHESYPEAGGASSAARDPLVDGDGLASRVSRGGSFSYAATFARSATRSSNPPSDQVSILGVRPSRALRLSTSPPHNAR